MISKIYNAFYSILLNFCKALLLAQILIVAYVVFGRFILHSTPAWGEESALICMVWFCLVSSTLAIRDNTHLRMEVIEMVLPAKVIKIIDNLNHVLVFLFAIFLIVAGIKVTALTALNVLPGIGLKASWLYAAVPVTGFTLIFAILEKVRK